MKTNLRNIILTGVFLGTLTGVLSAQSSITGVVKSGPEGSPLPYVTVTGTIFSTVYSALTDENGIYNLIVPTGTITLVAGPSVRTISLNSGPNQINFWNEAGTDADGNIYSAVEIGTQVWMGENLTTTTYNDASKIPYVGLDGPWINLTTGAYCWYSDNIETQATYGALYNWHAVNSGRLCPLGWHVPSDSEWTTLTDFLGGITVAGGPLKEVGSIHWLDPNAGATNTSLFTGLPGGSRDFSSNPIGMGDHGKWWSSTSYDDAWALARILNYYNTEVTRADYGNYYRKIEGLSIRCIKDVAEPIVTTTQVSSITATTAQSGGYISPSLGLIYSDGRGVCWSTSPNPTIDNGNTEWTEDLSGTGSFISILTGLQPSTTYYVRAYGMNMDAPTFVYGNEVSFTTLPLQIIVTSTDDDGPGTLRNAIESANTNPGPDEIVFNIEGTGPFTIRPLTQLPVITDPVIIDGFTQPGASSETSTLLVELDGINAGIESNGITIIASDNCTVRGLVINRFSGSGIYLDHANGNTIEGNFIGTDKTGRIGIGNGSWDEPNNLGNGAGISLYLSNNNRIGGSSLTERNLISANPHAGIWIRGYYDEEMETVYKSSGNLIKGNLIGTDINGTSSLANRYGIEIDTSVNNLIGGVTPGERNIISGNLYGIRITGGDESKGNSITGNYIGTNISGTTALGNSWGIFLYASETTIGGSAPGAGNIISGSLSQGLSISGGLAHQGHSNGNIIKGNYVGVDAAGLKAIPNSSGIMIVNSGNNQIGGKMATEGNLISGNTRMGLYVGYMNATNNRIEGNRVGVTADGKTALGNGIDQQDLYGYGGISINGPGNTIGGIDPQKRNIISGNLTGITLRDSADNCIVLGNYIGTDITGTNVIPNINNGIAIKGGKENTIGGFAPNSGNIISGNLKNGIILTLSDVFPTVGNDPEYSTGNFIQGNFIGTDITGIKPLGNGYSGIHLGESASNNTIGGNEVTMGNLIAFNQLAGIVCASEENPGTGNIILSNSIHSNIELGVDLGDDGPTPNDTGDSDIGANSLQNYPVIESVSFSPGFVTINGYLNSTPDNDYVLQFFANKVPDNEDFAEGQTYLGNQTVTTDPTSGNASFLVTLPIKGIYGQVITATATDLVANNTSEFSKYVGGFSEQILGIKWPMSYVYNSSGAEKITDGTDITAITNSFKTWSDISTSSIKFNSGGPTDKTNADVDDGINLVSFMDNEFEWPVGVLAYASKTVKMDADGTNGQIIDADIIVNPAYKDVLIGTSGATDETGTPGYYDIQSIITHEIGHILGMLHSGLTRSTMFFWMHKGSIGKRTLESDDLAWAGYKYPGNTYNSTYGTISGNITYGYGGFPVAGALVTAINSATGISFHSYSDAQGDYTIPVLSGSNQYYIHIEPLDGDVNGYPMYPANISSYIYCNTAYTDYPDEFFNDPDTDTELNDNVQETASKVSVGSSGINIKTNQDLTPPEVVAITPDNGSLVKVLPDIIITFSEQVDLTSFTEASCYLQTGTDPTAVKYSGSITQWEGNSTTVIFTPKKALPYSATLTLHLLGMVESAKGITDLKGNVLSPEYHAYSLTTIDPDVVPPRVTGSVPANGATGVFVTDKIYVSFSEPMNKTSVENNFTFSDGTQDVGCSLIWNNQDNTVTFTPVDPLSEDQEYKLTLFDDITDLNGVGLLIPLDENDPPLKDYIQVTFTTVKDGKPFITYLGPGDGDTDVPVNTPLVIDFSEPVMTSIFNPDSPDYNPESFKLQVKDGASSIPVSYEVLKEDSRVVFRPETYLSFGTTYEIMLSASITDKQGNHLDLLDPRNKFPSVFTTSTEPLGPSITYIEKPTGVAGDEIIIAGKGFDPVPANNLVSFAGTIAPVGRATLTSLNVRVPVGTVSGEVTVKVNGSTSEVFPFYIIKPSDVLPDDWATSNTNIGNGMHSTDLNGDCTIAFVTNSGSNTVSVVDIDDKGTLTWRYDIKVGEIPLDIELNSTDTRAYVTNFGSHTVSVIDLTTVTRTADPDKVVVKEINVGINPYGVAVVPDGDYVYVANYTSQNLTGIDINPSSGGFDHAVTNVNLGSGGRGGEITGDAGLVLVATDDGLKIVNIDPQNKEFDCFNCVVGTASSGTSMTRVEVTGDATYAIATTVDGRLLIIDVLPGSDYFGTAVAGTSSSSPITRAVNAGDGLHIYATTENHELLIFEIVPGGIGVPEGETSYTGVMNLKLVGTKPGIGNDALVVDALNQRLFTADSELDKSGSSSGKLYSTGLYVPPQAPEDRIAGLIQNVIELMYGSLKLAKGNELISFLNKAIVYIEAGKKKDAINRLNTFIVKVKDLIKSRSLTPDENYKAQDMINTALEIIAQLKETKSGDDDSTFTDIDPKSDQKVISQSELGVIYPNPSKNAVTIDYEISAVGTDHGKTSVNVYDLSGRLVRILVNSTLGPGRYSVSWDGNSENGTPVSRGIYFIRLESGNTDQVRQILLVR